MQWSQLKVFSVYIPDSLTTGIQNLPEIIILSTES